MGQMREWWKDLTRDECQSLLEGVCIQCYDHESLVTLQEAVRVNVMDGTIPVPERDDWEND